MHFIPRRPLITFDVASQESGVDPKGNDYSECVGTLTIQNHDGIVLATIDDVALDLLVGHVDATVELFLDPQAPFEDIG